MLNLKDVRKSYGKLVAVDGLSLSVRKGETLDEPLETHGGAPTLMVKTGGAEQRMQVADPIGVGFICFALGTRSLKEA